MHKLKVILLWVGGVLIFITLSPLCFVTMKSPQTKNTQGYSETYQELSSDHPLDMLNSRLPRSSKEIVYRVYPYMVTVEINFKIKQKEFLNWMEKQNWDIAKITRPRIFGTISIKGDKVQDTSVEIEKGYHFEKKVEKKNKPEMLKSALIIYYDSDTNRCYYRYSSDTTAGT